jgi:hypothetical protein
MDSPLVVFFLTVIALTALLQAGCVAAIAVMMRAGNQTLHEFEEKFEAGVVPQIRSAARLTEKAAEIAEKSLAQARRVDGLVAGASRKAERYVNEAAASLEGAATRAAIRVDSELAIRADRVREHRFFRKLSSASAFITGVQRALEVWQATAAAQARADEEVEEEMDADGDPPPDPSPA